MWSNKYSQLKKWTTLLFFHLIAFAGFAQAPAAPAPAAPTTLLLNMVLFIIVIVLFAFILMLSITVYNAIGLYTARQKEKTGTAAKTTMLLLLFFVSMNSALAQTPEPAG